MNKNVPKTHHICFNIQSEKKTTFKQISIFFLCEGQGCVLGSGSSVSSNK